ncbi:MAG: DNA processing protein [Planctomycetota bacterium]|jgi:DNA processing protein
MKTDVRLLTPNDELWPDRLREIDSPPKQLWLAGDDGLFRAERVIAIVGTRSPTPYGQAQAERFSSCFAAAGVVVVSGLARGIDSIAHAAALDAGGGTIAVLGSGIERPWPREAITDRMRAEGLIVSEFPPDVGPRRHHFPLRNRIISGLSVAVLVVEAAWASGSLITARWAVDQNRDVYAIPGRVDHPMSRGGHRLIREGATLIESPEALLEDLGWAEANQPASAPTPNSPLLKALTGETLDVGELAHRAQLEIGEVLVELARLELAGAIVRAPGGLYRRAIAT